MHNIQVIRCTYSRNEEIELGKKKWILSHKFLEK